MTLAENLARAALSCALDPIHNMGPRERSKTLISLADNHPQLLKEKINALRKLANELEDYLKG